MVGVQIPILGATIEYGLLLGCRRFFWKNIQSRKSSVVKDMYCDESNFNDYGQDWDRRTLIGSLIFIIMFNIVYWTVVMFQIF